MRVAEQLRARVVAWIDNDPDPEAQAELRALLEADDAAELEDRFAGSLEFGTAGLRGVVGAGPRRMNRATAMRATAGLCRELLDRVPDAAERGLCIGYDGRRLSREMAEDVAAVAAGAGVRVHRFDRVVPTPLLAFAVRHTRAAAGVMVTASHNPREYNGYKVYWERGSQIVPPLDSAIAGRIEKASPARALPRVGPDERDETILGDEVIRAYLDGIRQLLPTPARAPGDLVLAHTSLHGVGAPFARAALLEAGFEHLYEVEEQRDPNPAFPTVAFPNPEEPGAMDHVLALARAHEADLALANDPDADRLAVAVRSRAGDYVMLTGNEIGCLLADHVLANGPAHPGRLVINTIVSSPLLASIARAHGARFEQTLTGFKWIAHRALELADAEGLTFVFGYEEALGYSVGDLVRDKDGISAAVATAHLAARCRAEGRTLLDELERIARTHGLYLSRQISRTDSERGGLERIAATMEVIRRAPPQRLGGFLVERARDVREGNLLVFDLREGHRAMVRPSGTEPKLKYYVDVRVPFDSGETLADARARGERWIEAIAADLTAERTTQPGQP